MGFQCFEVFLREMKAFIGVTVSKNQGTLLGSPDAEDNGLGSRLGPSPISENHLLRL